MVNILKLLIPQVFDGMKSFNSPDFDGVKCTQLSPLEYKISKMIQNLQTMLYKNDAIPDATSPDFLYDLPDLIVVRLLT